MYIHALEDRFSNDNAHIDKIMVINGFLSNVKN